MTMAVPVVGMLEAYLPSPPRHFLAQAHCSMDPILLTFARPHHDLDCVGSHVLRENLGDHLRRWRDLTQAQELVYVATCQRVLWILWGGDPSALALDPTVLRLEGQAAWTHLLSLAAGLESANLGDREIPGQLRDALEAAREVRVAGEEAVACLEDVIREGHRLRHRLGLDHGHASVASVALKRLERCLEPGSRVALVGVGPMSRYLAERLPSRGYQPVVFNRTLARAQALAVPMGLMALPLQTLQESPEGFDGVVTATASPTPIFTLEAWKGRPRDRCLLLLDLALPPDSEPDLERLPWVQRLPLGTCLEETEQARSQRREAALQARPLLQETAQRLGIRAQARASKRRRAHLQDHLRKAWDGLDAACAEGPLAHLDHAQRQALHSLLSRGRVLAFRALAQNPSLHERSR